MIAYADSTLDAAGYEQLVARVRALIRSAVPPGAKTLVVSRGDGRLVEIAGCSAGHFPQTRTGLYAGHYPADSHAAVAHIENLRAAGAEYLVIPVSGLWWLSHYPGLRDWLAAHGSIVEERAGTGILFRLRRADEPVASGERSVPADPIAHQVGGLLDALLPPAAGVALIGAGAASVPLGDRPRWTVPLPGAESGLSLDAVLAQIDSVARRGARYLALIVPERRSEAPDERLRRELAGRGRRICNQRLVELFELGPSGGSG